MDERARIIRTLEQHHADLAQTYGVRSLALFGSLARNEATALTWVRCAASSRIFGAPLSRN